MIKETRQTLETNITVTFAPYGTGSHAIDTGIGFFDHMLTAFTVHGGFDLTVAMTGDLQVDCHHSIEDCGIVLGKAFAQAVDKNRIARYGMAYVPMDEALGFVTLDISQRPFLVFDAPFRFEKMGQMDTAMVQEFFRAFAFHAGITLHVKCLYGDNDHHKAEALFKALGRALRQALVPNQLSNSTKGVL